MKLTRIASAIISLSIGVMAQAHADDNRYVIQVNAAHQGVVKALAKKLGGEIQLEGDEFIAATFTGKDLAQVKGLLNNPHITLIEEDVRRYPMATFNDDAGNPMAQQVTPYAVYQSQANQVKFNADAGMKVCIIDSGLDSTNPDFDWNNIKGDNDSGTGNWNENGGPHGTHVAGTIGALNNDIGVVGMAPGVAMHIVKVFNADGWGYSSTLAKAAKKCSQAGANIISMSLGGGRASKIEQKAFDKFTEEGGLVVAAAGNDGNDVRSYPAGYPSIMMVGANDANNNIASFSQFPSCLSGKGKKANYDDGVCVEITAGGVNTLSTYPAGMAAAASLLANGNHIASSAMENLGEASGETYYMGTAQMVDANANGKVCLIDRGAISFHDKVLNCENSGGIGVIVINNVSGMLYGTLGETNQTSIPAVGAALEDKAALTSASTAAVSIKAVDYGFMSGTSMATPAVSGIAALVWSNHSDCTGTDIRNALKATAMTGPNGKDEKFGYGIVNAKAADVYLNQYGCSGQ